MVGTEQHGRTDLGVREAVSARRGVLDDPSVQRITGVIAASAPETYGARGVHRDAAETNHSTAFEMSYGGPSMILRSGIFLPAVCFLIRDDVLYRPAWSSDHVSPSISLTEQIGYRRKSSMMPWRAAPR